MVRFLRRFLSIQRPVARFLSAYCRSLEPRLGAARLGSESDGDAGGRVCESASPATCGAGGRVLGVYCNKWMFELSQRSYTQPWHHLYA